MADNKTKAAESAITTEDPEAMEKQAETTKETDSTAPIFTPPPNYQTTIDALEKAYNGTVSEGFRALAADVAKIADFIITSEAMFSGQETDLHWKARQIRGIHFAVASAIDAWLAITASDALNVDLWAAIFAVDGLLSTPIP